MKLANGAEYKTAWFCEACGGELTHSQRMYSHGRCPLCGVKGPGAVTIVNTTERAYWVEHMRRPWWMFWKPQSTRRVFVCDQSLVVDCMAVRNQLAR